MQGSYFQNDKVHLNEFRTSQLLSDIYTLYGQPNVPLLLNKDVYCKVSNDSVHKTTLNIIEVIVLCPTNNAIFVLERVIEHTNVDTRKRRPMGRS